MVSDWLVPVGAFVEETSFNLLALASRNGPTLDTKDWAGSTMPNFGTDRKFGFPILDGGIRPPGNCNIVLQYAVPTFPVLEPPVLTWSNGVVIGAPAATWTTFSFRISVRFARIQIVDTSGAANNGIYLVTFIRGA